MPYNAGVTRAAAPLVTPPTHASRTAPVPPAPWTRRHLLGLGGLTPAELRTLLSRAAELAAAGGADTLHGRTVATMFFEDSTRTRTSFTLAARRMGAEVVDLSAAASSVNKGETLIDTARTIRAMGVDAAVVRTRQAGAAAMIAAALDTEGGAACSVINAGDGKHEHPTQGLLDLLTIAEAHGRLGGLDLSGLRVVIVGDVASSRVARSAVAGLRALGAESVVVGPPALCPPGLSALGCRVARDFDAELPRADAVMMLRVQFERHETCPQGEGGKVGPAERTTAIGTAREYREFFGLSAARAALMKDDAVVLHPGPTNRGLEIESDVADGPRSRILRQVTLGVPVRMAALEACILV
ncbi:MAG: aspartate carbamoyltransferase catalytic subunit [Phycisphaerales bacterium]|nr:aspartate carbamoyltransferase catalytic subunit [Phycisphaerales bacterium]